MAAETTVRMSSGAWLWPVGLVGALGMSIAVCVITAILASGDPSFALEPDYYQRAVAWDESAAARDASARLGWTAGAEVSDPAGPMRERTLSLTLRDDQGEPIGVDRLDVIAFHHARRRDQIDLGFPAEPGAAASGPASIVRAEAGAWAWSLGPARAGVWQVRVRAARGADVFLAVLDVETPDGGR